MNGGSSTVPGSASGYGQGQGQAPTQASQASPSGGGFVAVNARQHHEANGHGHSRGHGTSSSTRHELLAKFHTTNGRSSSSQPPSSTADARRSSMGSHTVSHPSTPATMPTRAVPKPADGPQASLQHIARPPQALNESELHSMMNSPVPIPNTPSNLLPASSQRASQQPEKDDGGPFKVEMVHRMEGLAKGERIIPPCDRCRRLHMDCLKNLTACVGCTKKHAKCSWKEVKEGELRGGYTYPPGTTSNGQSETSDHESGDRASTASPATMMSPSHHGLTPSHIPHGNGQHTPQHQQVHHPDQHPQPPQLQRDGSHDARAPSGRNTPHERERNVDTQLQEAAQSSLAHADTRLGGSEGKGPTMVA
jgi:hypothetical protein